MRNFYTYFIGLVVGLLFFTMQSEAQTTSMNEGAKPKQKSIAVKLYPNPSDGEFKIEVIRDGKGAVTAKLFDMTGQLVEDLSEELNHESGKVSADISLKDQTPGIYFLRVKSGSQSGAKKIVIR
jgi:hypothetical protein